MAENTADKHLVNFAEMINKEGEIYAGPSEPRGFRALKQDGYYAVEVEEATAGEAEETGNGVINMVVRVLDEDEKGVRVFANVTCDGFSKKESHRPNIYNLVNLLLSAGRTQEQLHAYAKEGKTMQLGNIAKSLTQPGKNRAYAQIKHEIAKAGKMVGKEVARVSNFILQSTYEKQASEGRIRWDKSFDKDSTTSKSTNGVSGVALSDQQLDAASAAI